MCRNRLAQQKFVMGEMERLAKAIIEFKRKSGTDSFYIGHPLSTDPNYLSQIKLSPTVAFPKVPYVPSYEFVRRYVVVCFVHK